MTSKETSDNKEYVRIKKIKWKRKEDENCIPFSSFFIFLFSPIAIPSSFDGQPFGDGTCMKQVPKVYTSSMAGKWQSDSHWEGITCLFSYYERNQTCAIFMPGD